jgi:hypothetical protein
MSEQARLPINIFVVVRIFGLPKATLHTKELPQRETMNIIE